ncbi:MAG: hypothetical protein K2J53_03580 [Alistipes sp.]|nr:hypothetical protein [Alistipes sp.]
MPEDYYGFEKIAYEIVERLKYTSYGRIDEGGLLLTTEIDEGPLETRAEYLGAGDVRIRFGTHEKRYYY